MFGFCKLHHVLLVKGMIPKGDAIRPGLQEQPRMFRGQPRALARVLAIHDDKIQPPARAQGGQSFGDSRTTRAAHHIAKEHQFHGPKP